MVSRIDETELARLEALASHLRKDQNSIGTRRARALENAIAEWHAIVEAAR